MCELTNQSRLGCLESVSKRGGKERKPFLAVNPKEEILNLKMNLTSTNHSSINRAATSVANYFDNPFIVEVIFQPTM